MLTSLKHTKNKIYSLEEAMGLIKDGDTIVTSGFAGTGSPDSLFRALRRRFDNTGHPRDLTYTFPAATGDGCDRGVNFISAEGLVKRVIFGHIGLAPKLQKLIVDNKAEGYNLPLGVIAHLYRDIAAGKPGTLTKVGLGTFADPRFGGGKMNDISKEDFVRLMEIDGDEFLLYKKFPINIALVRGTRADPAGNVSLEHEALNHGLRAMAAAVHNSGGKVIVQVKKVVETEMMTGRQIHLPACLVDAVVLSEEREDDAQTYLESFNPTFCGDVRVPENEIPIIPLNERKIIARRAAMELEIESLINLGIGMPEGVASIAAEEGLNGMFTLTTEAGVIGGVPCGGLNFGVSYNPEAFFAIGDQFDLYDGGGLDAAFLGLAQADKNGNINVSKFGTKIPGFGGFINISQNSKKVIFMGSFTAGGLEVAVEDGVLKIVKEGVNKKFIESVEQCTFNGSYAAKGGAHVLYITERCVFKLVKEGLELIEVAPGIDIERDIVANMEFTPIIKNPIMMDERIFRPEAMGLKKEKVN